MSEVHRRKRKPICIWEGRSRKKWQLRPGKMMSIKRELGFCENHYLHMDISTVRSQVEWYLPTLQENAIKKKKVKLDLCRKIWKKVLRS